MPTNEPFRFRATIGRMEIDHGTVRIVLSAPLRGDVPRLVLTPNAVNAGREFSVLILPDEAAEPAQV